MANRHNLFVGQQNLQPLPSVDLSYLRMHRINSAMQSLNMILYFVSRAMIDRLSAGRTALFLKSKYHPNRIISHKRSRYQAALGLFFFLAYTHQTTLDLYIHNIHRVRGLN